MKVFLRTWQEFELEDIEKSLFVIGEINGECFACHTIGIGLKERFCPNCKQEFKYIAFRRKIDGSWLNRFREIHPRACFIEFDDFKKFFSKKEARKLLDI
ncbi:MAG: hypothetical protein NC822_02630 [Candidatus Omnitrophica bacterium]|nr:hypothetical protein [Candidatus Omnitrophota bacterium]MCM8826098.1 hypothetical protein [Candidatus Omnitrophota bacterium]